MPAPPLPSPQQLVLPMQGLGGKRGRGRGWPPACRALPASLGCSAGRALSSDRRRAPIYACRRRVQEQHGQLYQPDQPLPLFASLCLHGVSEPCRPAAAASPAAEAGAAADAALTAALAAAAAAADAAGVVQSLPLPPTLLPATRRCRCRGGSSHRVPPLLPLLPLSILSTSPLSLQLPDHPSLL